VFVRLLVYVFQLLTSSFTRDIEESYVVNAVSLQEIIDTPLLNVTELARFHPANALFHSADAFIHTLNTPSDSLNAKLEGCELLNDQGMRISYDLDIVSALALHKIAQFFKPLQLRCPDCMQQKRSELPLEADELTVPLLKILASQHTFESGLDSRPCRLVPSERRGTFSSSSTFFKTDDSSRQRLARLTTAESILFRGPAVWLLVLRSSASSWFRLATSSIHSFSGRESPADLISFPVVVVSLAAKSAIAITLLTTPRAATASILTVDVASHDSKLQGGRQIERRDTSAPGLSMGLSCRWRSLMQLAWSAAVLTSAQQLSAQQPIC